MLVRKKNGTIQEFDNTKIADAAMKAFLNVSYTEEDAEAAGWVVASDVERQLRGRTEIHREEIHDLVQLSLMDVNRYAAVAYIVHRNNQRNKHGHIDTLITALRNISVETSKDNANISNSPASKMYQIGSEANKHYVLNHVLPKYLAAAHIMGEIHIHDIDFYQLSANCITYDLGRLLDKGFNMPHGFVREPKSIHAAGALAAVTMQLCQNQ
jgi:ribonucleoside-triphosphate reductase